MGRCLIVANQTLGGDRLDRTIREHIERGDSEFFIVVPLTSPKHEATAWSGGFFWADDMTPYQTEEVMRAMEEHARTREVALDEARRRAEGRLSKMIGRIRAAGGNADGVVGDADPVVAVRDVLEEQSFAEIIVSTLPAGISRWLKMDLPSRVSRMTDARVTTVEAAEEAAHDA